MTVSSRPLSRLGLRLGLGPRASLDRRLSAVPRHGMDKRLSIVAASAHDGDAAVLVRRLKYGRCSAAVGPLADAMAAVAPPADIVTWVPASRSRRRDRGYDQSELLARAVARRLGLPARRTLRRVDDRPQTARSRQGRALGPDLAAAGRSVGDKARLLLIDDVVTTGATLRRAAAVLSSRGAAEAIGLVATRAAPGRTDAAGVPAASPPPVAPAADTAPTAARGRSREPSTAPGCGNRAGFGGSVGGHVAGARRRRLRLGLLLGLVSTRR